MNIRHAIRGRFRPRGVTPRRLAAARRALWRERQRLPLFAEQVAAEQLTPEERILQGDLDMLRREQTRRDLAAKHWRWGRRMLAEQDESLQEEILAHWKTSWIPPQAAYFADFVRSELKRRGIPT